MNYLIEKLPKNVNMLEGHILFLEGNLAATDTISKLLGEKADDSRTLYLIVSGVKQEKNGNMENLAEAIIDKLEQTGIPKEELKTNIDKLHRTRPYQPSANTQPMIVKFKSHSLRSQSTLSSKIEIR